MTTPPENTTKKLHCFFNHDCFNTEIHNEIPDRLRTTARSRIRPTRLGALVSLLTEQLNTFQLPKNTND